VNLRAAPHWPGPGPNCDIYIGSESRIDVSSEAGSRFDQNITGFRAEEEFGFNAEAYVRTGKFVKILGFVVTTRERRAPASLPRSRG
jgi:hypothetical protein